MSQDGPQRVELSPDASVYTPPRPGLPVIVHGKELSPRPADWKSPTIDTPPQPPATDLSRRR